MTFCTRSLSCSLPFKLLWLYFWVCFEMREKSHIDRGHMIWISNLYRKNFNWFSPSLICLKVESLIIFPLFMLLFMKFEIRLTSRIIWRVTRAYWVVIFIRKIEKLLASESVLLMFSHNIIQQASHTTTDWLKWKSW